MHFKPFRPPAFLQKPQASKVDVDVEEPASKKRKISEEFKRPTAQLSQPFLRSDDDDDDVAQFRLPLAAVKNPAQPSSSPVAESLEPVRSYSVLWRKVTAKKHKTWDGDGVLTVSGGYASLKNERSKYMGRTPCKNALEPGTILSIGGMDVEIDNLLTADPDESSERTLSPPPAPPASKPSFSRAPTLSVRPSQMPAELMRVGPPQTEKSTTIGPRPNPASVVRPANAIIKSEHSDVMGPKAKHDPHAEGALVLRRPKMAPRGKQIVDVVVDPFICRKLRQHQREGVAFMYECVMGLRFKEGSGAILADEMGLGKTLQTIALLWTLLKQNPIYGDGPIARKAVIICPASVVKNWRKEFRKWLGGERVGVLALSEDQKRVSSFIRGRSYQVLILSYEMFNSVHKDLQKCEGIDIVVADEGHRLKSSKNKTIAAVNALDVERRLVLTGTLLQNDYSEWYSVVDFVNPGFLGKYSTFKKDFENPILRSRQQNATQEDIDKGNDADQELKRQTGSFILRRTQEVLAQYLPGKTEYIVICRPTAFQSEVYRKIIDCGALSDALGSNNLRLPWINILKKACNSPSLLAQAPSSGPTDSETDTTSLLARVNATIPASSLRNARTSGKLHTLDSLLHRIRTTTTEKVVLMSNYTSSLDLIAFLLTSLDYRFLRLDGTTPQKQRQDLVDTFNNTPVSTNFVFLLSTKAGGVGLNLIGASRLVLFDMDWNPAHDDQAMARICRDGQKRACWIYRLVAGGGAIEEKILMRQVLKRGLADSVVDGKKGGGDCFSREEVRDLFTVGGKGAHQTLGCGCAGDGKTPAERVRGEEEVVDEDVLEEPRGLGDFKKASQLVPEDAAGRRSRSASPRKKVVMEGRGLMEYAHIDAGVYRANRPTIQDKDAKEDDNAAELNGSQDDGDSDSVTDIVPVNSAERKKDALEDDILRHLLLESGSAIDFVFAKTSERNIATKPEGEKTGLK